MKFIKTFILSLFFTLMVLPQVSAQSGIDLVKSTPGYYGKKNLIGYDFGFGSSYASVISVLTNENAKITYSPSHTLSFERIYSKHSSFGLQLSFVPSVSILGHNSENINDNPLNIRMSIPQNTEETSLQHPNFYEIVDPSRLNSGFYNANYNNVSTSGFGLSAFGRSYFTKSFAPLGWFLDLHVGFWHHSVKDIRVELREVNPNAFIGANNGSSNAVLSNDDSFSRTTLNVSYGLGYNWPVSENLLFTMSANYNLVAIINYYRTLSDEANWRTDETMSFEDRLATSSSYFTYLSHRANIKFGLRYAL
jgi:hypothetical protein